MTKIKNALFSYAADGHAGGFGGINRLPNAPEKTCTDIRNLRLLSDGTLESREGYEPLTVLGSIPRALWAGNVDGEAKMFALVGSALLSVDPDLGTTAQLGTVGTSAGEAEIFWHGGTLFLLDGEKLYSLRGQTLSSVCGYAPLLGDGWDPALRGPVCEPVNFLSDRVRVRFLLSAGTNRFALGFRAASLDAAALNGSFADAAALTPALGTTSDFITCSPAAEDGEITFWLTLATTELPDSGPLSCTHAVSFGDASDCRLCCWGGTDTSEIFISRIISPGQNELCTAVWSGTEPLYLPVTSRIRVGEGRYPVTALCRHFDRMMLFTSGDAWSLDWDGREADPAVPLPRILPLSSSVGCTDGGAAALCGNDPVTVFEGSVYRWHSPTGVRNECSAAALSEPLCDLFRHAAEDCTAAFAVPERNEIWFSAPLNNTGRVFIYHYGLDAWYTYDGIYADRFFKLGGEIGFVRREGIYMFRRDLSTDTEEDQELEIPIFVSSPYLDFGDPTARKRGVFAEVCASPGAVLTLALEEDGYDPSDHLTAPCRSEAEITVAGAAGYAGTEIGTGHFRHLRWTLSSLISSPVTISGIRLRSR